MYKIALAGKAGTGKNTAAEMLIAASPNIYYNGSAACLAFADPIKQIVKAMFPQVKTEHLYGPSHFRKEVIKGAKDAEGNPLTIRRILLDIGTDVGRSYLDSVWIDNMDFRIQDEIQSKKEMIIITDVRFRNEFDWLKSQGFFMIKVFRDSSTTVNHISESGQDDIKNEEYHYLLNNNGNKGDLFEMIKKDIIPILPCV